MWIDELTDKELELHVLIEHGAPLWLPDPENGPQCLAYLSDATVLGYGGAAGGGKSDLGCGLALNSHDKSLIMRRQGTELTAIIDRLRALLPNGDRLPRNGNPIWYLPSGQQIEFGSAPNLGDETKYQGRPHDLKFFDEATNFLLQQIMFLSTWLRSVDGYACQLLLTFNPPQDSAGRWVLDYFAPWLDERHPNPAMPGEKRCFVTVGEKSIEVPDMSPVVVVGKDVVRDFDSADYGPDEIIVPQTRAFIPARVSDNKYLYGTNYVQQLQALPEPLRSQMLRGDFTAGLIDSEWQVIPTEWVKRAQARWEEPRRKPPMTSMGVDVARGGRDNTIIYRRHEGMWIDKAVVHPGALTPDGPRTAGLIIAEHRDHAPIHIDVVGVGSSPYDFLKDSGYQVMGVNGGVATNERVKGGVLGFANMKSLLWWRLREALDPANNTGIALPPDEELLRDLTAPLWKVRNKVVQVETREEIIKRIGRSPDWGSALVLAMIDSPRIDRLRERVTPVSYDPLQEAEDYFDQDFPTRGYDPLAGW